MSGMSNSDPRARLIRTAEPLAGARPLPDDGADHRERDADPQPAEDAGQGGRDLERGQDLALGRAQAPAELDQPGVHGADADHRRDGDREEHDQRADDDLAQRGRARTRRPAAARGRGSGRPGPPRCRARRGARRGRSAPARSRPAGRARHRRRSRPRSPTMVVAKCGQMVPSSHAPTNRSATAPGGGRMYGWQAVTSDDRLPDQRRTRRRRRRPAARRPRLMMRSQGRRPRGRPRRRALADRVSRRSATRATASRSAMVRGRGMSTAMSATTRPGRGDMTTTRSATRIASGMLWVTITIVLAERSQSRSSSRSNRSRVSASSALNGSSRSSTAGSSASARARATRWAVPPDSSDGRAPAIAGSSPTRSVSAASRASRRSAGHPASSSGYVMLAAADRQGSRRGSWKTRPIRASGPVMSRPSSRALPPVGCEESRDDAQEGRLAAAVRADQSDDPAARDRRGRSRRGPAAGRVAAALEGERQVAQLDGADAGGGSDAVARSAIMPAHVQRSQDRRGRRIEGHVRRVDAVVESRRARGVARSGWSIRVIAPIADRRSAKAPIPTAPRIAEPRTAVSSTRRDGHRKPVTSAFTVPDVLRAGPPHTRISSTVTPASSIGSATWRIASAEASTIARAMCAGRCPRVRPARTPRAVGSQIGERSPARYGRNTSPSAPGGVSAASAQQRLGRDGAAEDRRCGTSRAPGLSTPSPRRRCSGRPAAPGVTNPPGTSTGDPNRPRTRRPTRPDRRRHRARAGPPRGSWRTRRQSRRRPGSRPESERVGGGAGQLPDRGASRGPWREAIDRDAGRRHAVGRRHPSDPGRAGRRDPCQAKGQPLPRREIPAGRRGHGGLWRSTHSAAGRPARAQPRTSVSAPARPPRPSSGYRGM